MNQLSSPLRRAPELHGFQVRPFQLQPLAQRRGRGRLPLLSSRARLLCPLSKILPLRPDSRSLIPAAPLGVTAAVPALSLSARVRR